MGRLDLDCHYAVEPRVSGAVHLTHTTRTQLALAPALFPKPDSYVGRIIGPNDPERTLISDGFRPVF